MLDHNHLQDCIAAICDPILAENPVAWFDLEKAGITRELLAETVQDIWQGQKPYFDKAPDRESKIWKLLQEQSK
jgi:hypothetical protein